MKGKSKRIVSGFLSALTIISSIMQPVTTYAAEAEPAAYEAEYPDMEKVKGALAEDEIVTAEDYEVEAGTGFDVKSDFSGMKIHPEKVKVTYHEAKNQNGQAFDGNKADTYHAVYFVEPVSGHPSYHVQRNIVVREPSAEIHKEKNAQDSDGNDQTGGEDAEEGETDSHKKKLSETELNQALEALKGQDTYDEESGLKLLDVMEQFKNHMIAGNVDLLALEEGETVTFTAYNPKMLRSSQVEVSSGGWYYYADYGLGSYLTCPFTVKFGSVTATAYCIQPSKPGPGSGVYEITKLGDGKELSKVCYYGTNASGEDCFFDKKYPDFSAGKRFVVTHLAASYAEGSEDAFYGANDTGIALAKELYSYAVSQPEIPDAAMAFSDDKVTAYVDGNIQRTKEVTFQADSRQSITMKLPKGVKFHNVSTGKISNAGADVVVKGGTTFFLSAPLTQTEDVGQNWSAKMKGSITKDYSAYKITTGSDTQNLALVFGEGIEEETTASFQVTWLELAKVQVVKVDSEKEDAKLSGAVFGIYKDKNCTQLIKEMPKTDKNGTASVEIVKTQDTVYLKEITAPTGYRINTSAYNVKLVANQSTSVTVPDKEQLGELTVYKEGQVLTGADLSEKGIVFRYEKRRQKGAVYSVYAGEDIMTAYGAQVYKKGELVKEHLVTGDNGAAVLKNLHLGTYIVKEMQAPENFYNAKEEKTVTLSYAGQNAEAVFSETTFINDRQKAKVSVVKKDKDTEKPLDGGIFGLYAGNDIVNADGIVVVKKGSLIEKAVTGEDGTAIFTADLPIGNSYYVKEEQAPSGYQRNKEDIYSFKFSYTNDSEADVSFSHTFVNERVTAKIFLKKKDAETNKAEPQGDATLEKAVYGLYAREDIVHPDGATGVIYKAGDKVASLTTNEKGEAVAENLYLGKYFVKEITGKGIRAYGYTIGNGKCGIRNTITDVPGVKVGHYTVRKGKNQTGVTVIIPCDGFVYERKPLAAVYALNGFGKTQGTVQIEELGVLETPIALTNTLNVGKAADGLVTFTEKECRKNGKELVSVNPVVGETNDSRINQITERVIEAEDVLFAIEHAEKNFKQGAVGAGRGTVCFGLKGGIGSASRILMFGGTEYTIGVLVQSNFGKTQDLTVAGVPVGRQICTKMQNSAKEDKGSIMVIVGTDLPLGERQLKRVLKRAAVGLIRTGSFMGHGSGDVFIGFTNANGIPDTKEEQFHMMKYFPENQLDKVFRLVAEAVEESILNSLTCAKAMLGRDGEIYHSLSEFL